MNRRYSPALPRHCAAAVFFLLAVSGMTSQLQASSPENPAPSQTGTTTFDDTPPSVRIRKRDSHFVPRDRSSHSFFVNVGGTVSSVINFKESTSGTLNNGVGINTGYSWISRKGLGVGVVYSGNFFSAERNELQREAHFHYIGAEFVARQRVGRRWLFRESTGWGYAIYTRTYGEQTASKCGVGGRYDLSVQYMLTRHLGVGLNMSGQWLVTKTPDISDGFELNLFGTMLVNYGGGLYLNF